MREDRRPDDRPTVTYHNIEYSHEKITKKRLILNWIIYLLATYGLYSLIGDTISFLSR